MEQIKQEQIQIDCIWSIVKDKTKYVPVQAVIEIAEKMKSIASEATYFNQGVLCAADIMIGKMKALRNESSKINEPVEGKEKTQNEKESEIRTLFEKLSQESRTDIMAEFYYNLSDYWKDEFLRKIDCE